jgi:hypothetical protein
MAATAPALLFQGAANGTGTHFDFGTTMKRVAVEVNTDSTVTAGVVTVNGAATDTGYAAIAVLTFTHAGSKAAFVWYDPASTYEWFNCTLSGYAGTGNVTVTVSEAQGGTAGSSAGAGVGAF